MPAGAEQHQARRSRRRSARRPPTHDRAASSIGPVSRHAAHTIHVTTAAIAHRRRWPQRESFLVAVRAGLDERTTELGGEDTRRASTVADDAPSAERGSGRRLPRDRRRASTPAASGTPTRTTVRVRTEAMTSASITIAHPAQHPMPAVNRTASLRESTACSTALPPTIATKSHARRASQASQRPRFAIRTGWHAIRPIDRVRGTMPTVMIDRAEPYRFGDGASIGRRQPPASGLRRRSRLRHQRVRHRDDPVAATGLTARSA